LTWNRESSEASKAEATGPADGARRDGVPTPPELGDRLRRGTPGAFEEVVTSYQDRIYNTCWRMTGSIADAEDLTQEVFLRALRAAETFRAGSSVYTWLFRIAVNLAISHRRKRRLRAVASLEGLNEGGASGRDLVDAAAVDPAETAARHDLGEAVARALGTLDVDERAIVVLRDIEGLSYAELADVLEVPLGTVKSRVHRARAALRAATDRLIGAAVAARAQKP